MGQFEIVRSCACLNGHDDLKHAVALHFMHCNFCRVHQTLRVTPAMEAGIANHVWRIDEITQLLDKLVHCQPHNLHGRISYG